jgi:hypothetical protein
MAKQLFAAVEVGIGRFERGADDVHPRFIVSSGFAVSGSC